MDRDFRKIFLIVKEVGESGWDTRRVTLQRNFYETNKKRP